jgi:hypothetical protein
MAVRARHLHAPAHARDVLIQGLVNVVACDAGAGRAVGNSR